MNYIYKIYIIYTMKCLFIFTVLLILIIIFPPKVVEGLNGGGNKSESDPWALNKKREKEIEDGIEKRNERLNLRHLFEMNSHKLFYLFDKDKNKQISHEELMGEESVFEKAFIDEFMLDLENKQGINYHEFKDWYDNIVMYNKDEFVVCPQKEQGTPMNVRVHLKIFDITMDPFSDIFIKDSKRL